MSRSPRASKYAERGDSGYQGRVASPNFSGESSNGSTGTFFVRNRNEKDSGAFKGPRVRQLREEIRRNSDDSSFSDIRQLENARRGSGMIGCRQSSDDGSGSIGNKKPLKIRTNSAPEILDFGRKSKLCARSRPELFRDPFEEIDKTINRRDSSVAVEKGDSSVFESKDESCKIEMTESRRNSILSFNPDELQLNDGKIAKINLKTLSVPTSNPVDQMKSELSQRESQTSIHKTKWSFLPARFQKFFSKFPMADSSRSLNQLDEFQMFSDALGINNFPRLAFVLYKVETFIFWYLDFFSSEYVRARQSSNTLFKSYLCTWFLHLFIFFWTIDAFCGVYSSSSLLGKARYVPLIVEIFICFILFLYLRYLQSRSQFLSLRRWIVFVYFSSLTFRSAIFISKTIVYIYWLSILPLLATMVASFTVGIVVYFSSLIVVFAIYLGGKAPPSLLNGQILFHLFMIQTVIFVTSSASQRFAARTMLNLKRTLNEFMLLNQRLIKANEVATRSNKVKSRFLRNISHELWTPLSGILGCCEELRQMEQLDENTSLNVIDLYSSAETLQSLISDMLTYAKLEARDMDLEVFPFSIPDVIEATVNHLAASAQRNGLEITLDISPDMPIFVVGDAVQFSHLLRNLISNAIKFTPEGEIRVTCSSIENNPDSANIHVAVEDTGIGIPPDKVQAIFEAFSIVDDSITRQFEGAGLGLAIAKKLSRLFRGKIWCESDGSSWSTFHITARFDKVLEVTNSERVVVGENLYRLWMSTPTDAVGSVRNRPPSPDKNQEIPLSAKGIHSRSLPSEIKETRVLIVEDNISSAKVIMSLCDRLGMKAYHCESRETGVLECQKAFTSGIPYEVILLDQTLPESKMTLTEFIKKIQEISAYSNAKSLNRIVLMRTMDSLADQHPSTLRNLNQTRKPTKQANTNFPSISPRNHTSKRNFSFSRTTSSAGLFKRDLLSRNSLSPGHQEVIKNILSITKPVTLPKLGAVVLEIVRLFQIESIPKPQNRMLVSQEVPRLRILVVDDNAVNLKIICRQLESLGHQTSSVCGGQEAIDILFTSKYDLVLMDIFMPGLSGIDATRVIRKIEQENNYPTIPIIAITANSTLTDRKQCLRAGMNAYVPKPINVQKIEHVIQKVFAEYSNTTS